MAVIKLGDLTTFTGDTSGSWFVMNDPTNTATYKVQRETLVSGSTVLSASYSATASFVPGALTGTGVSGQVSYWNGTTTQTGSNNLFWDAANNRLGIGTNAPSFALQVNGSVRFGSSTTLANNTYFDNSTFRLGIGVISPTRKLDVSDNASVLVANFRSTSGNISAISLSNNISTADKIRFGSNENDLTLSTNFLERFRIFNNGNVAIGTTTDSGFKLDVNGTARFTGNFTQSSGTATFGNGIILDSTSRIFSSATVNYQGNSTTVQNVFSNAIGSSLNGTIVRITNGTNAWGSTTNSNFFNIAGRAVASAGSIDITSILIDNQVGTDATYSGTIRGIYYNPSFVLGSGFTHYAIQTVIGDIYFASTSGSVGIGVVPSATYKLDVNGTARIQNDLTISDTRNIILATGTGTKIGTATTQKLAFFNATPIVQPTTGIAEAAFVENSGGTAVNVDSTFAGYTLQQIAQALKDLGVLA